MFRGFFGGGDEDESTAPMTSTTQQPSLYEQARAAVGLQPTVREEIINTVCPALTFKQRVYGFAICFCIGCVISLSSMFSFHRLLAGHPAQFAIKYSLGNTIALLSTGFLMGPKTQLKRMSHPTRWIAALVYVLAIIGTITFCFTPPHSAALVVICICIQARATAGSRTPCRAAPSPLASRRRRTRLCSRPWLPTAACCAHRVQCGAMFWYCLSYIPFGRRIVMACCKSTMDM